MTLVNRTARSVPFSEIKQERQVWLWENRIPISTISALAGAGGTGKTTYAIHVIAQLSNGTLPGEYFGHPQTALIWSGEDKASTQLAPRLTAAGADLAKVRNLVIDAEIDGETGEVTPRLPLDVSAIRAEIDATGSRLVLIDPIASTMHGDLHKEADVRATLDSLARMAEETSAVIMYIRHFGKGGGNASDKMSGNHAFRDAARSVFLFADDDDQVVVTQDKGNYAPRGEESFAFRLESVEVPAANGINHMARVIDLGASDTSVGDIINRTPGPAGDDEDEHDYTDDLKTSWLYQFLDAAGKANTVVRPKDSVAYAADKGISRRTVFRLFEKLANAGMAESADSAGFPRVTHWRLHGGTTAPAHGEGGTTGTTGDDLHKQGGTTGQLPLTGGTTGDTVPEQHEQGATVPVVPVVPPVAGELGSVPPPGGITSVTPGDMDRVALAPAKSARRAPTPLTHPEGVPA